MWLPDLRTTKRPSALVLVALLLAPFLSFWVSSSMAAQSDDNVWVLTETSVNPDGAQTEFYGGGAMPYWFPEPRFDGKHTIYTVTETSCTIDDRSVDHGYEYHWVVLQANFQEPPTTLVPGESIALDATFQTEGTLNEGIGYGMQFQYSGDGLTVQPAGVYWYTPWHPDYDGTSSTTYTFDIPRAASGGEIAIHVGLWNEPPCHVVWKYRAGTPSEAAPTEAAPTKPPIPTAKPQTTATPVPPAPSFTPLLPTDAPQPTATPVPPTVTFTPVPTDRPMPTHTVATDIGGGVLQGDCVKDGRLDERDATCALRMSVGLQLPDLSVDMDGSGDVTSRDATLILQEANLSRGGP